MRGPFFFCMEKCPHVQNAVENWKGIKKFSFSFGRFEKIKSIYGINLDNPKLYIDEFYEIRRENTKFSKNICPFGNIFYHLCFL